MSDELDRKLERIHELEKQLLSRIEDYDAIIAQLKKPKPAAEGFYAEGIDIEVREQQGVTTQGVDVIAKTVTLGGITFGQYDVLEIFDAKGRNIKIAVGQLYVR